MATRRIRSGSGGRKPKRTHPPQHRIRLSGIDSYVRGVVCARAGLLAYAERAIFRAMANEQERRLFDAGVADAGDFDLADIGDDLRTCCAGNPARFERLVRANLPGPEADAVLAEAGRAKTCVEARARYARIVSDVGEVLAAVARPGAQSGDAYGFLDLLSVNAACDAFWARRGEAEVAS